MLKNFGESFIQFLLEKSSKIKGVVNFVEYILTWLFLIPVYVIVGIIYVIVGIIYLILLFIYFMILLISLIINLCK